MYITTVEYWCIQRGRSGLDSHFFHVWIGSPHAGLVVHVLELASMSLDYHSILCSLTFDVLFCNLVGGRCGVGHGLLPSKI